MLYPDPWLALLLIALFVIVPYVVWKLSRSANGRSYLRAILPPFGLQLAILLFLCAVEYDWFGLLPTGLWTLLRVLCWLGSLFGPFVLQAVLLYRSAVLKRLAGGPLRVMASGLIAFPLALLGLIAGHLLFCLANHGLLFD